MILQALAKYYERMIQDQVPDVEPVGYKRVAIPFVLVLKKDGRLAGIDDTRKVEGRRPQARPYIVPKVFEGSRTVNVLANLLWDKASYVFGVSQDGDAKRLKKQKDTFLSTILNYFPNPAADDGVKAIVNFLEHHQGSVKVYPAWEEIKSNDPNLAFRLENEQTLICNREGVKRTIIEKQKLMISEKGLCLVTGQEADLAKLENPIKGLRGSGKAESHLVSFNDSAYWSYGKTYGANAPISKSTSSAYVIAINFMQREGSRQWLKVGDATTVFWAEKKHKIEDWFIDIFGEPEKGEPEQDYKSLIAMFRSPESGVRAELDPSTRFYVLGLTANAARIAIRYWYAGTVGDIADSIGQHFDDMEMVKSPKEWRTITLRSLLRSTALQEKDDNIAPNLSGDVMKSILTGIPYPQTLFASVISRIRAEQSQKDSKGKSLQNVTYTRAALIKACLSRATRYYNRNQKEVGMSLDITNINPGYLLGRLFAALEKVQAESAGGWGKINTTIRDRFYGAASSTPVTVFPHLMKLKNHHLSKMENYKGYYEGLIGEIMSKLDASEAFPAHLSLQDQGRFAVGYYHQRHDKKDK